MSLPKLLNHLSECVLGRLQVSISYFCRINYGPGLTSKLLAMSQIITAGSSNQVFSKGRENAFSDECETGMIVSDSP